MPVYKLVLSYLGTRYSGWQVQPEKVTIQGVLNSKLAAIFKEDIPVVGAGRTDAGVHALGQVAHIRSNKTISPDCLKRALNSTLPSDIAVISVTEAEPSFHARFCAKGKFYRYWIYQGDRSPFYWPYSWFLPKPLDIESIRCAISLFEGTHDFSAFSVINRDTKTNSTRTITRAQLLQYDNCIINLEFEGDGFLRKMVRRIVGTLVDIGRGRFSPDDVEQMFSSKDPRYAGPTAPAQGLFLAKVDY
ncbi:MAG: tRNA pseudouridine(38-40) synthase TruA [bacterium]